MISVCMATYNGEKYIKEQVDSIICQLDSTDELIISDDGSTDGTLLQLREYGDNRIKIYNNEVRHGVVGNFENALSHAQGDYLFLCDQDDIWESSKVQICLDALGRADLVMHDAVVVDEFGKVIHPSFFKLRGSQSGYWKNLIQNSFLGCSLAFRRSSLDYILPLPNIAMHDIWIGLMVSRKGMVELIDKPLLRYRRHGNNASPTAEKSNLSAWRRLNYRIKMLYYTSIR